jgi:hypothetical protein
MTWRKIRQSRRLTIDVCEICSSRYTNERIPSNDDKIKISEELLNFIKLRQSSDKSMYSKSDILKCVTDYAQEYFLCTKILYANQSGVYRVIVIHPDDVLTKLLQGNQRVMLHHVLLRLEHHFGS